MSIYHFSVKNISRADGRSAVAAAAYRSGEKLIDERQGKEQDYTKKTGVELKKIYAPEHTNPELLDRNQLWNKVEKVENRKNSQLAREFEIAFPHELKKQEREQMLNELCQEIVKRHGVIVDAAIHAPHTDSGSDERNYHAHIMFTTRSIDEHGNLGGKTREFNDNGKQEVEFWREKFADITNKHLNMAGFIFANVDHRSYADQGDGLQATIHEGSKVTQLRRLGIDTEISLHNDAIKARNAENFEQIIKGLDQEILATEKNIAKLRTESPQGAKNTKTHTELTTQNKNALERKSEPSSHILQNISSEDKKTVVQLFKNKIDFLAKEILQQELQDSEKRIADAQEACRKSFDYIENLKDNKPINPFKINAWREELKNAVNQHNNKLKPNHSNLVADHHKTKNNGVTHEHWLKADAKMRQLDANGYQVIKQLEVELKNSNANVSVTRSQDHSKGR